VKEKAARQARAARVAATEKIGRELMDRYNRGLTDPSLMAVNGHSTATGYEFFIDRDGSVHTITVTLGWEDS